MEEPESAGGVTDEFLRMFAFAEQEIHRYIFVFVPNENDAMEVLQETCVILWKKFRSFPSDDVFTAWACRVAYYEVLKLRKRQGQDQLRFFNDEVLDAMAEDRLAMTDTLELRRSALVACLEKLPPRDRELIMYRYDGHRTAKQVGAELGRPMSTVYKSLDRIRRQLLECVTRTLRSEEHAG